VALLGIFDDVLGASQFSGLSDHLEYGRKIPSDPSYSFCIYPAKPVKRLHVFGPDDSDPFASARQFWLLPVKSVKWTAAHDTVYRSGFLPRKKSLPHSEWHFWNESNHPLEEVFFFLHRVPRPSGLYK